MQIHLEARGTNVPVHSMVAGAFLGPRPSPKHQVRHLDGDRMNNRATNLAWGSVQENMDDRERHGTTARGARNGAYTRPESRRRGELNGRAILSAQDVADVRHRAAAGETKASIARALGVSWSAIDRAVAGLSWAHLAEEDARREADAAHTGNLS